MPEAEKKKISQKSTDDMFKSIISNDDVTNLYFNAFIAGVSDGDMVIALLRNNEPVGVLNMSYTVGKTLGLHITKAIADFESDMEQEIMTIEHVKQKKEER